MPKNSFLIEDILESSSSGNSSKLRDDSYRGYKKRTLTTLNHQPTINTSSSDDSTEQLVKSPVIIKPSPSLSLSPASSFTSSASSTNSHTPEEAATTNTGNIEYLIKQQYLKSTMPLLLMNGYTAANANDTTNHTNQHTPDMALLFSTLLQQSAGYTNPDENNQYLQQQMLSSYYAKLIQSFTSNLNPNTPSEMSISNENDSISSNTSSRRSSRMNESSFLAASKNIYKLDESKLKQFGSFASQQNYFLNSLVQNPEAAASFNADMLRQKINSNKMAGDLITGNQEKIVSSGMSPPASGDDCSSSSIENVSPLDALLKLANNTFINRAGLISNPSVIEDFKNGSHECHENGSKFKFFLSYCV
jgi:hypothetical protein